MMYAMAEQHHDFTHGRDPRIKQESMALVNPPMGYSMAPPIDHATSNEYYAGSSAGGQITPPISTLPHIVFTQSSNYNTAHKGAASLYSTLPAQQIQYANGPESHFPRTNPQIQDTLHLNTNVAQDQSHDAFSVGSVTPQSVHSKHSFSSFSDLRFPESSDSSVNFSGGVNDQANHPRRDDTGSSSNIQSRSPYEAIPSTSPWDQSRMMGFDQPQRTQSHNHNYQLQQPHHHNQFPSSQHQQNQFAGSQNSVQQLPLPHAHMYRNDPGSEMTDQQVKNLLMITNTTSSSTGKRKPRESQETPIGKEEGFTCKHCGKVFAKGYNLKSHLKTHSDERPFQCSFCDRSFARNHDKKRHELLHQGVKKFQCGGVLKDKVTRWGCGKRFSRADGLGRHFRTDIGWLCIRPLMVEAKEMERQEDDQRDQDNIDDVAFGTTFINELLKKAQ